MNTHIITKPAISTLALTAWFLLPQAAHGYYNPSTGRWLSRDPKGEQYHPQEYAFARNSLVNSVDLLGLEVIESTTLVSPAMYFKWQLVDLGSRTPNKRAGETSSAWVVNVWSKPCPGGQKREVHASGDAVVSFWWSTSQDHSSRPHELTHAYIYKDYFLEAYERIQGFAGQCMCPPKAECYAKLGNLIWSSIEAHAKYDQDSFDCNSYGDTFGACSRLPKELSAFLNLDLEADQLTTQCDSM
jgi:hypothetical protein